MLFSEVIGQQRLKNELIESVKQGRIPHSQLFSGDTGYGSLALAIAYAQYINCANRGENDSCGVCGSCYKYNSLQHPDLHFVFPINKSPHAVTQGTSQELVSEHLIGKWRELFESSKPKGYFTLQDWYSAIEISKNSQGNISRHEANHLISKLNYKSFEKGYKVIIIWLAEYMNDSSANALLKMFEEPANDTLFLFVTHDREHIMKTILSRTQTTYIKPIDSDSIKEHLSLMDISADIDNTAKLCEGSICNLNIIIDNITNGNVDKSFELFTKIMRLCFRVDHLGLLDWVEEVSVLNREEQKRFLIYSIGLLRDSFIIGLGLNSLTSLYAYEAEFIKKFYPYIHNGNIEVLISEFEKCNYHLSQNGSPKIIFTHFTLAISKLVKLP